MAKSEQQQLEIDLPDKKYFTIGEVSELCQLKSHVLRYWEQAFPQLNPNKRRGRRYYQRADLELLFEIKTLLYEQGYTISGAKARLNQLHSLQNFLKSDDTDPQGDQTSPQTQAMQHLRTLHQEVVSFKQRIQQHY